MIRASSGRVRVALAGAAALWLCTSGSSQDVSPAPGARQILQETYLPAVDAGLRENDPPREPGPNLRTAIAAADTVAGAEYAPDRVIVKFRSGAGRASRATALAEVGGTALEQPDYANFELMRLQPGDDPEAVARELSERDDVEYAQACYKIYPYFKPNDPLYSNQWNFPAIDMERAWDINQGATSDIIVAVIDTGIAFRDAVMRYNARAWRFVNGPIFPALGPIDVPFSAAPELRGSTDRFVAPRDFIWNDNNPFDLVGHGTHVAGTIGQLTNNNVGVAGMAFNVRLMPVKALSDVWDFVFGNMQGGTDDVVARAVRYAVDNGAKVLNMSIGRTGPAAPVVEDAIKYAVGLGAFVAIAGGNGFERGNLREQLADIAQRVDGAIAVAAVGRDLNRAYYSTTGDFIEIAAPGGNQRQGGTTGGVLQQSFDQSMVVTYERGPYRAPRYDIFVYDYYQGTSMATPHVAGFAAMLMQQGITKPAAIEAAMKLYATDQGSAGRDNEFGAGLINPRATLRGLGLAK